MMPNQKPLQVLLFVLLAGYMTLGRSFAHWGLPPLYVGELALGAILLFWPPAILGPWIAGLTRPTVLSTVAWVMFASLAFGLIQMTRGYFAGYDATIALQNLVFHVYPLFFFCGASLASHCPDFLRRSIYPLAWIHGVYGVLFIAVLSPLGLAEDVSVIDSSVAWFGQPSGSFAVLLGLLSFEPNLVRAGAPLLLNTFVLLGIQVRAIWLAAAVGVPVWGALSSRMSQVVSFACVLGGLALVGWVCDFSIPAPSTRVGQISVRAMVGRAVAAIDRDTAREFTPDADQFASTVEWRTGWWSELWKMVHASPATAVIGPGYGFAIWNYHPEGLGDARLRTPHNVFMYALSYTGWSGVLLYCGQQLALGWVLWHAFRRTGQPFGVCYWLGCVLWASVDNFMEAPFTAIPFYLLTGLAAGPLLTEARDDPRKSSDMEDESP